MEVPMLPVDNQLDRLLQGIDTVVPEGELRSRLEEGRPLRVKFGVDPTAPDVTLGWAVVFRLLRRFQELGHTAVLIVGDFTAQVGDPSARSETRKRLDAATVGDYASSCLEMIKDLLLPERLEIRPNSEWLSTMTMTDVLELTSSLTVAQLLERADFKERFADNRPISMIEFMYPLLQGYDSVAVEADVELGGADQLWNLMIGRVVQERYGQRPQLVMTVPLLVGTDGTRKMSQSFGNYISVRDSAEEMFGKTMSVPDAAMEEWFVLAAGRREDEARAIVRALEAGERHPGETKRQLARAVVAQYWDGGAAEAAEAAFDRIFKDKSAPEDMPEIALDGSDPQSLPALLEAAGLVASRSEARRLIKQGAVKLKGRRVEDEYVGVAELDGQVLQVGKRRFVRVLGAP
ncbi:MAG TPA: tyrosine--tRNA ligase [Acidimicrobiia bacterium]|jgi:tyrosyl-tRNA synthetase|nr:tyrosine--tRNA ligase [Acidimicrobiia bacterium]